MTTATLTTVQAAGIELVELFCDRRSFDYRDAAQVGELRGWLRDSTLKLHSLHSPMHSDEYGGRSGPAAIVNIADPEKIRRRDAVDEVKRALEAAEEMPFRYLVQHVGNPLEEYDARKMDAAFASLSELNVFAKDREVEILLENIPNELSTAARLRSFVEMTHLPNGFCFDIGHAHIMEGVEAAFALLRDRIRSTHVHDNDGRQDLHLFPLVAPGGTVDWRRTMEMLESRPGQYALLLELKEAPGMTMEQVRESFGRLESAGAGEARARYAGAEVRPVETGR